MRPLPPGVREILISWEKRLSTAQKSHYILAEKKQKLHLYLGLPLVCTSSFISVFLLTNLENNHVLKIIIISMSITTTIIASLVTFLRPSELAEKHRYKATKYGSLKRKIELHLSIGFKSSEKMIDFLRDLANQWDEITEDAPVAPITIIEETSRSAKKEIDELIKNLKPNQNSSGISRN